MSKVKEEIFAPSNFEFVDMDSAVEFDFHPGSASAIANAVFYADGGRRNHQHASSFIGETIEVATGNYTAEPQQVNPNRLSPPRVFVPERALDEYSPNAVFAQEFQKELDKREYANRMSIPVSLGFMATIDAIPTGILFAALSLEGVTKEEAAVAVGGGIAIGTLLSAGVTFKTIYRRIVTNPKHKGIYQAHLSKAIETAEDLDLAPVISRR